MLKTISLLLLILSIICILTLGMSDIKKMIRSLIYSNEDYLDFTLPPSINDLKRDTPCDTNYTSPTCPPIPPSKRPIPCPTCSACSVCTPGPTCSTSTCPPYICPTCSQSYVGINTSLNISYIPNLNVYNANIISNASNVKFMSKMNDENRVLILGGDNKIYTMDASCDSANYSTSGPFLSGSTWYEIHQRDDDSFVGIGSDNRIWYFSALTTSGSAKPIPIATGVKFMSKMNDGNFLLIGSDYKIYKLSNTNSISGPFLTGSMWYQIHQRDDGSFVGIGGNNRIWSFSSLTTSGSANQITGATGVQFMSKMNDGNFLFIGSDNRIYKLSNTNTTSGPFVTNSYFRSIYRLN
jgi:hypothetical protein